MEEVADWDLQAVVRAFTTASSAASAPTSATSFAAAAAAPLVDLQPPQSSFSSFGLEEGDGFFRFQDPFGSLTSATTTTTTTSEDLEDLYKPFCSNLQSPLSPAPPLIPVSTSAMSILGGFTEQSQPQRQQLLLPQQQLNQSQVIFGPTASMISASSIITPQSQRISAASGSNSASQPQRTKKRKNVLKKVCHVPAEGLSSDMWAWRKYGQKPIKGSPYPRGYYRCSSSKGCMARKQVERNRSDPKMFIVTYTAEHNHPMPTHRNSLAGSTRQKPLNTQQPPAAATSGENTTNSPNSNSTSTATTPPAQQSCSSPTTEKSGSKAEYDDLIKDDADNEMDLQEMMLDDDFFTGFDDLDGVDTGDSSPDQLPPSMEFPWLVNSSSTATAAGGS